LNALCNCYRTLALGPIAAATTFLFRRQQFHTHQLGEHVSALSPQTMEYLHNTQNALVMRGSSPATAAGQAYGALLGSVQRLASMLAFVDTFRAMSFVFLLVLFFLLIMKRPTHTRSARPMH
jgi:MFS transporter, DHA2 family, multidrug resistance protein